MTREHDPHLRDAWEIGAMQQAGNRDVEEPIVPGWIVVAGLIGFIFAIAAVVWLVCKSLGAPL